MTAQNIVGVLCLVFIVAFLLGRCSVVPPPAGWHCAGQSSGGVTCDRTTMIHAASDDVSR